MECILVGLDASPRARDVLVAAETLARRMSGRLILFRAVGVPREIPPEAYASSPAGLVELLQVQARRDLDAIAKTLPSELVLEVVVSVGTPWQAICAVAETRHADLIVIGSHGYSGLDHLLGTTAAKVVNHASCSVLVVRQPSSQAAG